MERSWPGFSHHSNINTQTQVMHPVEKSSRDRLRWRRRAGRRPDPGSIMVLTSSRAVVVALFGDVVSGGSRSGRGRGRGSPDRIPEDGCGAGARPAAWLAHRAGARVASPARRPIRSELPPERWAPALIETMVTKDVSGDVVDELRVMIADFHPAATRVALRAFAEADLREVLPRIEVPTLILCGFRFSRGPRRRRGARPAARPRAGPPRADRPDGSILGVGLARDAARARRASAGTVSSGIERGARDCALAIAAAVATRSRPWRPPRDPHIAHAVAATVHRSPAHAPFLDRRPG